jgi:hypothetical protein
MATYATAAEWYDAIANLTVFPHLGQVYVDQSPVFVAFGIPNPVTASELKNNWSDGATGVYVNSSTYASTGTVSKVDDSTTSSFAHITAPAQLDIMAETAGGAFALNMSMAGATHAIYDKFVHGAINGANTGNELSGFDTFLTAAASTPVSTDTSVSGIESNTFELLDNLKVQLATEGENFILTSRAGHTALKVLMRAAGGTTPVHDGMKNFGFGNVLEYDGMPVFATRHLTTVGAADELYYMVNTGPNGAQLVVPTGKSMWVNDGPKSAPGVIAKWWDIVLRCQLLYMSPRAVGKAQITQS